MKLVFSVENVQNRPAFLCHCCGCCCGILEGINKHGYPNAIAVQAVPVGPNAYSESLRLPLTHTMPRGRSTFSHDIFSRPVGRCCYEEQPRTEE